MMYAVDWICLGVLVASLLLGAWRGLLFEAFSLGGWVLAYFVARLGAAPLARVLPVGDPDGTLPYIAAFALLFIAVAFCSGMLAQGARSTARALGMRPADRIFGALFGAARGVLLLLVAAAGIHLLGLDDEPWWQDAASSGLLHDSLLYVQPLLPDALAQYLDTRLAPPAELLVVPPVGQ